MSSEFKSQLHHLVVLPFGKLLNCQSLRFNACNIRMIPAYARVRPSKLL